MKNKNLTNKIGSNLLKWAYLIRKTLWTLWFLLWGRMYKDIQFVDNDFFVMCVKLNSLSDREMKVYYVNKVWTP